VSTCTTNDPLIVEIDAKAAALGLSRAQYIDLVTSILCTSLRELCAELEAKAEIAEADRRDAAAA
jgi:hypothetical protein